MGRMKEHQIEVIEKLARELGATVAKYTDFDHLIDVATELMGTTSGIREMYLMEELRFHDAEAKRHLEYMEDCFENQKFAVEPKF